MFFFEEILPILIGVIVVGYGVGYFAFKSGLIDSLPLVMERPMHEREDYKKVRRYLLEKVYEASGTRFLNERSVKRIEGAAEKVMQAFYDRHPSVEVHLPSLICGSTHIDFRSNIRIKDILERS